uniref:Uncharacterized protein n=1 Tax=Vespula pensylvanica TaxID=30213 RepID=A0A834K4I7_VESPE|nr:hypothetical protein H0235_016708 [Vespula pensylvanica]
MLWIDIEKFVKQQKLKNLEELYTVIQDGWKSIPMERCIQSMLQRYGETTIQEEWHNISSDYCERLVQIMTKRINAVLKAKGL